MAANKLKNMLLKSVDLVRRGANPDADIKLFKSIDGAPFDDIYKSAYEMDEMIAKSEDTMGYYLECLEKSYASIFNSDELTDTKQAQGILKKSLSEFVDAVETNIIGNFYLEKSKGREGEEMSRFNYDDIDKNALSPSEADTLEKLLAKACKKPVAKENPDNEEGEEKDMHPEVKAALKRMDEMQKSFEMRELNEIAKKYEALGENPDELAGKLYEMKKSGENNYNEYIAVLEKSLELVNNSGIFGEIGKSAYSAAGTGAYGASIKKSAAEAKIETAATELMKSDVYLSYNSAIAKAWEMHPEIAMEYENERM